METLSHFEFELCGEILLWICEFGVNLTFDSFRHSVPEQSSKAQFESPKACLCGLREKVLQGSPSEQTRGDVSSYLVTSSVSSSASRKGTFLMYTWKINNSKCYF